MKNINFNKGFTIVETLVAVAILMIAIAGPLAVSQKGLMTALYAKDQVIATFLAQDALEFLKNERDNNGYSNFISIYGSCSESSKCGIDTTNGNKGNSFDLYDKDKGYTSTGGSGSTKSIFTRSFYLDKIVNTSDSNNEIKLIVHVSWKNGNLQNDIILSNQLFNII